MNSPIKYFGGKGTMFNNIIEHFPKRDEYDIYIEPFGGSFSVGLKNDPVNIEIYNDLEQNVYSLYKVLSNPEDFKLFKMKCDLVLYCDDIRKEFKEKLKGDDLTILERAFYFFYVNRTSHNGVGGFSKNTYIRRSMSKSISDFLSCIDRLPELHDRLSKVIVSNTDGVALIKKHNNPRTLIYCDPPYEQSTRTSTRYKVDMNREGHIEFLNAVIESKSKILISGYDCELYDVLSDNGFTKIHFDVKTISGNFKPKTKTEYLYYNYNNETKK
jgi:DNA adenine methylase